jgi:6-phosphogluconate dehydrogenase
MRVGMIGLGKMGYNLLQNMHDNNIQVYGCDINKSILDKAKKDGFTVYSSLEEMLKLETGRRILWVMLPAGKITNEMLEKLIENGNKGDIVIDGGNSDYRDSLKYSELFTDKGINYFDVGTSGGVSGARNGASYMIGGNKEVYEEIEDLFKLTSKEDGYIYTGVAGSGHYLKMVHNAILYGMMQTIGEGFELLHASQFHYDLHEVADSLSKSSVIRGWLMELVANAFSKSPNLEEIKGVVNASKSTQWTVDSACSLGVPLPTIAMSLFSRYRSKQDDSFSAKVVASLRDEVGGHSTVKVK